jgi:hypothetical protein
MSEGAGAVSAAPKTVTVDLGRIADEADEADEIVTALEDADRIMEALRDLADPRLPLPEAAALRERLREWVDELNRAHERVIDLAEMLAFRVRFALTDDDENEEDL